MIALISVLLRRKKLIVVITAAAFVVSALVSLLIPPRYVSSASMIPLGVEKDVTGLRDFFSSLGELGEISATLMRSGKNLVIEHMVRSRHMSVLLDERFDLASIYGEHDPEGIRERLKEHTGFVIKDEGVIVLSVEDESPQRAKEMVEAYIMNLDSILIGLAVENAEQKRAFLMDEIERREREILESDSTIQHFQMKHGLYDIEEQARAALRIAAALSARRSMLEVEKELLEMTLKPGSPELEGVRTELELLEDQLSGMRDGVSGDDRLFPPLDDVPGFASDYVQMFRKRKLQEFVVMYLRLQLEDARLSSNRRTSVLKVIDPPFVPQRRAWPKRKQIVMVSTLAAFLWVTFILLVVEQAHGGMPRPVSKGRDSRAAEKQE
jgi:capsule polysaccharide export protein KpsE/RkpR